MNSPKKNASKQNSKKRLLCVTLPESLLTAAKAYRRKSGFSSMSELLRAAAERASAAALKKGAQEAKRQISFRLTDELYTNLFRAANQSAQSIAGIVRALLENAPKLGIRPKGLPAPKKRRVPAAVSAGKSVSAAAKPKKSAVPAKPSPKKKSVPAKKASAVSSSSAAAKKRAASPRRVPARKRR